MEMSSAHTGWTRRVVELFSKTNGRLFDTEFTTRPQNIFDFYGWLVAVVDVVDLQPFAPKQALRLSPWDLEGLKDTHEEMPQLAVLPQTPTPCRSTPAAPRLAASPRAVISRH